MDITKCSGEGCILKDKCFRYLVKADIVQSYFSEIPSKIENGISKCDFFINTTFSIISLKK